MKNFLSKFILITIVIQSCGLSNQSIFDQVGNIEEIDYNEGSALYKTSITGVAHKNGFLYVTASVDRLLRKDDNSKNWELLDTLGYQPRDIVGVNNKVYVILSKGSSSFSVAEISDLGKITNIKNPIEKNFSRLIKLQNISGEIEKVFISATTSTGNGEKFVYSLEGQNITPAPSNEESIKGSEIKGSFPQDSDYFLSLKSDKESNQIHKKGMNPITVEKSEGEILYATGRIKLDGQETNVVASVKSSGGIAIQKIDLDSGKVDPNPLVKSNFYAIPSSISVIDNIFIVTTNSGYFEISESEGKKILVFPKETTDTSHYKAIKMGKIQSIYKINQKYYIATEGYGLWERDKDSKKWKAL